MMDRRRSSTPLPDPRAWKDVDELLAKVVRQRDAMLTVLKAVQRITVKAPDGNSTYDTCPQCFADLDMREGNHTAWCQLDAAIKSAEGR